jgi:hypothetical protein
MVVARRWPALTLALITILAAMLTSVLGVIGLCLADHVFGFTPV